MLNNTDTLTAFEISKIVADYGNAIELAVLDVMQYQPCGLYAQLDDVVSDATVAVMRSMLKFKRRYLSVANVTAWIRKRARWTALNAVSAYQNRRKVAHMVDTSNVVDTARAQDRARLEAALDVLTDESRTVLVALVNGEKAVDVAKRMKLSNATVTRRKQDAMKAIMAAMAS